MTLGRLLMQLPHALGKAPLFTNICDQIVENATQALAKKQESAPARCGTLRKKLSQALPAKLGL